MQGGTNPKRSGTGETLIYIMYRYLYIYTILKDTLRKREIAAVSTVKRSYVAFRVTSRRKHMAEQSGGQRGTLMFRGGRSIWGWAGCGSQGQKPSYTRWDPWEPCAPRWGARTGSGRRVLLGVLGGTCSQWAGSARPDGGTRWVPHKSLLRSPTDHPQRPEHPSPEGPLPWVPEELGSAACGVGQGRQQRLGG